MPGPLDYLRKLGLNLPDPAQSAPLAPGEDMPGSAPSWLDKPIETVLGAIGVGQDTPSNRFGQMLSAAVPFMGPGKKALQGLQGATEVAPEAYNAVQGLKGKFYSRLTDAATRLPDVAHPNKITSFLASQAAPEEMQYRGLSDMLKAKGNQMVSRDEVIKHLADNPITLGEKTLSGERPPIRTVGDAVDDWENTSSPKYSGYQLPGGENYHETLTTLPSKFPLHADVADIPTAILEGFKQNGITDELRAATTPDEIARMQAHYDIRNQPPEYQSPHWEEPNVLVHSRSQERTLPLTEQNIRDYINDPASDVNNPPTSGPKGRLVENVQSDWHQAGAKEGYGGPQIVDTYDRYGELDTRNVVGVPDAPFKQSWPDLALKQQLYDVASRPDLSWVGVTPGEELMKRGEGHSPFFNNEVLPSKLSKLLKPFGGGEGEKQTLSLPLRPLPETDTGPVVDPNQGISAWITRLSPEVKAAIVKKGFPIMSLLGLQAAQPGAEDASQTGR